jgi:heterodisulfide reductase subunit A-like polyferredoxin
MEILRLIQIQPLFGCKNKPHPEANNAKHEQTGDRHLMDQNTINGTVMVVGAGIAGMQASLDLANSGYRVYLVEKDSAIGGVMAQLDKTFPTNDCSM